MSRPFTIGTAIPILVAMISSDSAAEANKALDFLFSEDNQIVGTPESSIKSKALVRDDKWLNGHLTRLDYVLIKIQSTLSARHSESAQSFIREFFERSHLNMSPSVEFSAGYSDEKGRLFIGAKIDSVGKPKKPMREFCQRMVSEIEMSYPLKPLGYSWHNNALGLLMRDEDSTKYQDIIRKLAESSVINVSVSAGYSSGSRNGFFHVGCSKQEPGGPITFSKYSSAISGRP